MIPSINILMPRTREETYPTKTYKINFASQTSNGGLDRISGYVDGLDSIKQTIYLILSSERYKHIIYSWDYGVELLDLFGKPMPYVMSELQRRITEALTQDDRVTDVVDFNFNKQGKRLHTTFTVVTNIGDISTELEVEV